MAYRDEARGVGEDEIVDVGVLERRVGILPEAVEEEDDAKGGGGYVEGDGAGQRPLGGCAARHCCLLLRWVACEVR